MNLLGMLGLKQEDLKKLEAYLNKLDDLFENIDDIVDSLNRIRVTLEFIATHIRKIEHILTEGGEM